MFGFRRKQPAPIQQTQQTLGPAVYDGMGPYAHVKGQVITAGAEVWAFAQRFDKPQYDLIGAGFDVLEKSFMPPHQAPQVFANLNAFDNGLGGLQAGQMMTLPLDNTPNQVE